jgi:hypothetical protein
MEVSGEKREPSQGFQTPPRLHALASGPDVVKPRLSACPLLLTVLMSKQYQFKLVLLGQHSLNPARRVV